MDIGILFTILQHAPYEVLLLLAAVASVLAIASILAVASVFALS